MTEPVNLEYSFTENEYVSAVQAFYSRAYHTTFRLFLSGVVLLLGLAVLWFFGLGNIFGLILSGIGLFFFISSYRTHFVLPRQFFQRNPELRQSWSLQCTEDGLFFSSNNAESRIDWSFFREIWETPKFYFLLSGKDAPTIVAKSAFSSNAQETEFRALIRRKINPKIQRNSFFESKEQDNIPVERALPQSPPDWR